MISEYINNLLQGSYDLHIHTKPSHFPRLMNDFELVKEASKHEMAGVMIKNHYESTAGRAALVNEVCKDLKTRAYGGAVLNCPVGGINPYAVESALKLGAAFIWMPTRDSENCLKHGDMEGDFFKRKGINILDNTGKLLKEIYEIFDIVKKYDAVLATGHLSLEESVLLCKEGRKKNVKMVLTHPEWERTKVPVNIQIELADLGVIIEKNWLNIAEKNCTAMEMSNSIKEVGADRIFLATDRGQINRETPIEGLIKFAETLLEAGITYKELEKMMKQVPATLVQGK